MGTSLQMMMAHTLMSNTRTEHTLSKRLYTVWIRVPEKFYLSSYRSDTRARAPARVLYLYLLSVTASVSVTVSVLNFD